MSTATRNRLESMGLSANCIEVLQHLWDYLDDEITPTSAARLREHLAKCAQCRAYEGYQSCFLSAIAKLKAEMSAPSLLRNRLAEKLKGEGCGCWQRAKKSP